MSDGIGNAVIVAQSASESVDFPADDLHRRRQLCYWHPAAVRGKPLFQSRTVTFKRVLRMTPHLLDPVEKRIWWECLKRRQPKVAAALQDPLVQELLEVFNASIEIDVD